MLDFYLKNLWRWKCDLPEKDLVKLPSLETLKQTERSEQFEKFRMNRKIMGAFRYGLFNAKGKPKWDRINSIIDRAKKYKENGNDELLIDIANLCELEFVEGTHPKKHFHSVDDGVHVTEK